MTQRTTAYAYCVVPDDPEWSDEKPAFESHWSVTFEHPDDRFANMDGVTYNDLIKLTPE